MLNVILFLESKTNVLFKIFGEKPKDKDIFVNKKKKCTLRWISIKIIDIQALPLNLYIPSIYQLGG